MNFSTRGRYAIMAMLDLAEMSRTADAPITLAQIAERQRISLSYLEQLFAKMRKAGIVRSARGPGGRYTMGRTAAQVTLADVVTAVDEDVDVTRCKTLYKLGGPKPNGGCMDGVKCNAHDLWMAIGRHLDTFLARVTLQMVLDGDVRGDFNILPPLGERVKVSIN